MPKKITISGEIGWEVKPGDVTKQLDEAAGQDIDVYIASPGGFVFDGIEIFNAFRDYKRKYPSAQIAATIKGLAASMASYLAVNPVFDLIAAEDNAVFMIHNPYGGAVGDYRDMDKMSEILTGLSDLLATAYSKKSGKNIKNIRILMDAESWYFGTEIKDAGFVDEIVPSTDKQEKTAALAQAKLKFSALSEKLSQRKTDYQQAAAMLAPENNTPAEQNAGKINITEEISMTLKEFLDQNPAAKSEYEAGLSVAKKAGADEVRIQAAKAATFMKSTAYPEQVKNVALEVIEGKKSMDALDALAASVDMIMELKKSEQAKAEQKKDTPGETGTGEPTQDGSIKDMADYEAEMKRTKGILGQEVK